MTTETAPYVIESLFGTFSPGPSFKPLLPLNQCKEEVWKPIVEGLIYENQFHLLHGQKNTLKSWLAGYLAGCVSLGVPFLGHQVSQGKVCYIYGEGAMTKRLKRISKALGHEDNANIYPYALRADLTKPETVEDVKRHIPADTKLLIIDNYEKYWSSDVEDDVVDKAMQFVRDLKQKVAVILIQHDIKRSDK